MWGLVQLGLGENFVFIITEVEPSVFTKRELVRMTQKTTKMNMYKISFFFSDEKMVVGHKLVL